MNQSGRSPVTSTQDEEEEIKAPRSKFSLYFRWYSIIYVDLKNYDSYASPDDRKNFKKNCNYSGFTEILVKNRWTNLCNRCLKYRKQKGTNNLYFEDYEKSLVVHRKVLEQTVQLLDARYGRKYINRNPIQSMSFDELKMLTNGNGVDPIDTHYLMVQDRHINALLLDGYAKGGGAGLSKNIYGYSAEQASSLAQYIAVYASVGLFDYRMLFLRPDCLKDQNDEFIKFSTLVAQGNDVYFFKRLFENIPVEPIQFHTIQDMIAADEEYKRMAEASVNSNVQGTQKRRSQQSTKGPTRSEVSFEGLCHHTGDTKNTTIANDRHMLSFSGFNTVGNNNRYSRPTASGYHCIDSTPNTNVFEEVPVYDQVGGVSVYPTFSYNNGNAHHNIGGGITQLDAESNVFADSNINEYSNLSSNLNPNLNANPAPNNHLDASMHTNSEGALPQPLHSLVFPYTLNQYPPGIPQDSLLISPAQIFSNQKPFQSEIPTLPTLYENRGTRSTFNYLDETFDTSNTRGYNNNNNNNNNNYYNYRYHTNYSNMHSRYIPTSESSVHRQTPKSHHHKENEIRYRGFADSYME